MAMEEFFFEAFESSSKTPRISTKDDSYIDIDSILYGYNQEVNKRQKRETLSAKNRIQLERQSSIF